MGGARERVLDAAEESALQVGLNKLRVGHVAEAAGVSRQTVYNEFGDKSGLAEAVSVRLAHRLVDKVEHIMAQHASPVDGVAAAVLNGLRVAAEEPLIQRTLARGASDEMITMLTTNARPPLDAVRQRLTVIAARVWPEQRPEDIELMVDVITRLAFSSLVCPTEPIEQTARRAGELTAAVVERRANG